MWKRNKLKNDSIRSDMKIAKELMYPKSVIDALKKEKDPNKRSRILTNARKEREKLGGN